MEFGSERPTTCPLHFGSPVPKGRESCFLCELAGVRAVSVDPDRVEATLRAAESSGVRYLPSRSRAVLVFERPEGPAKVGDLLKKPPAPAGGRVRSTTDGTSAEGVA